MPNTSTRRRAQLGALVVLVALIAGVNYFARSGPSGAPTESSDARPTAPQHLDDDGTPTPVAGELVPEPHF